MPVKKIFYVLFPISLISAIFLVYLLLTTPEKRSSTIKGPSFADLLKDHTPMEPEKTTYNVLILGYGGAGHSGGGLADAQILASIDTENKKVTLIAIPRDSWVNLPVKETGSLHHKINAAFAIGNSSSLVADKADLFTGPDGGGELAKVAAKIVTGLDVDHYMAINFNRFVGAIDALGGIEVDVPVAFTDHYFPIPGLEDEPCGIELQKSEELKIKYSGFELEKQYECRYETLTFTKGPTQMDGETALKFIRSRHSSEHGGDFARGVREQAVLIAIKNKLLSLEALDNLDEFYDQYRKMILTDIDKEAIVEVLPKLGMPSDYEINKLNITTDNYLINSTSSDGQYILIPQAGQDNYSQIHSYIKNNL